MIVVNVVKEICCNDKNFNTGEY